MNKNELAGKWHEVRGSIKEYFADLTDDDILAIEADHDQIIGKLQQRYNLNEKAAELAVENMLIRDDGEIIDSSVQGEGDIEAARRFNAEQHSFAAQHHAK